MGSLKLSFSAIEAIEMMQEHFPNDYQDKINVGKRLIISLKNIYKKTTYEEAYQKYISSGCRQESAIMMLSALHQLREEEKQERENSIAFIMEQQNQIITQQQFLESDKNIEQNDKRMLRQHYKGKLAEIDAKFSQLCNAIEVIDPIIVNPNLFTQELSA